jgi:hypothetical protein
MNRLGGSRRAWRIAICGALAAALSGAAMALAVGGWQLVRPAAVTPAVSLEASAAVPGTDVLWLAGAEYPTAPVVFERRSGGRWAVMPGPATSDPVVVTGMDASARDDVWAVGYSEPAAGPPQPVAEHWNGSRWSLVPVPAPTAGGQLRAVAARSSADAWAVGWSGSAQLIEHWDGHAWQMTALPAVAGNLSGVAVVPGSPVVWAVGTRPGRPAGSLTLTERWNGQAWRVIPSPNLSNSPDAPTSGLTAVAAVNRRDVWAVGDGFVPGGDRLLVAHWNGVRWAILPGQPAGTFSPDIARVPGTRTLWIVATRASGAEENETFSERITPRGASVIATPSPDQGCEHSDQLVTVSAEAGTVWAAGFHYHLANGCGDAVTGPLLMRHAP